MSDDAFVQALRDFCCNAIALPGHGGHLLPSKPAPFIGSLIWEELDGWRYPWRVTNTDPMEGYPCGEPRRVEKNFT